MKRIPMRFIVPLVLVILFLGAGGPIWGEAEVIRALVQPGGKTFYENHGVSPRRYPQTTPHLLQPTQPPRIPLPPLIVAALSWNPDSTSFVGYWHTSLLATDKAVEERVVIVRVK